MNRRDLFPAIGAGMALGTLATIVGTTHGCATPAPTAEAVSPALAIAIERHRAALASQEAAGAVQGEREEATCDRPDDDTVRAAFDAADDTFDAACHVEQEAHHAVLAAPILTLADMRAKAAYLASVSRHMIHDGGTMAMLLASMGAKSETVPDLPSEPDPMRAAVEEYEAAYAEQGAMVAAEDWPACEAIYEDRIRPACAVIRTGPAATSLAGAIAAVRYVASQTDWLEDDQLAALRSALAFFNGRA